MQLNQKKKKSPEEEAAKKDREENKTPEDQAASDAGGENKTEGESPAGEAASPEEKGGQEEKAKITETQALKLYLEQALREAKKYKDEAENGRKELEDTKEKLNQYQAKLSSVVAEYDNYRRRSAAEKENCTADAVSKAVGALLPALDSLERAVAFADSNPESFKQGVEMTLRQLNDGFISLGVAEIEAQGSAFDPERHNAVMHVEDETLGDSVVTEVFQKGYAIGERVIRHAMVKVAN